MPNKSYAKEWLFFAKRNLDTALLLYRERHYEDIIGVELQQTLEKTLKAILVWDNKKIQKEHDLVKIYFLAEECIPLNDEEITKLRIATNYYKEDRYPNPNYFLPSQDEIKAVLDFTQDFFDKACRILDIDKKELEK